MSSEFSWFSEADLLPIIELLKSGKLSGFWKSPQGGPYLQAFERSFARYNGAKYAVGVLNGTVAIHVSLLACGVGRGDLVAVSPYTHVGSVAPILMVGAKPIFVDVEPRYGNIDPDQLRHLPVKKKVKAVIVAHQLGQPSEMEPILEEVSGDAFIVEDASQALGAEYKGKKAGTIGDVGCFSIGGDMTKTITTGEGGMIITNNNEIADKCRNLRNHGEKNGCNYLCLNYRLSDLQAAVGLVQMKKLKFYIDWQVSNAKYLISGLPDCLEVPEPASHTEPVFYIIGCRFLSAIAGRTRDGFLEAIRKEGFEGGMPRRNVGSGYSKLIYEIPFYKPFAGNCLVAEKKVAESVWIDWHRYPRTTEEIDEFLSVLKRVSNL